MTTNSLTVALPTSPEWLAKEASSAPRVLQQINAISVHDAASLAEVDALTKQLLGLRDRLEAERKSATGPLLEVKRKIDGWFKPVTDVLDMGVRILKGKESDYLIAEKAKQDALYAQAARAHEAAQLGVPGAHEAMAQALVATSTVVTAPPKGTSVREVWDAEIFNPSIVPCSYHCVDAARIQAEAQATPAHETPSPIPGVRFVKRAITTMQRR